MDISLQKLAEELELLATKNIVTPDDIKFIYQYTEKDDPLIIKAYDQVFHFFSDVDIWKVDPEYHLWQKSQLMELAMKIRQRIRKKNDYAN